MNPKIIYSPEWIAKILSGQKTMTIRRTQYPCGVYDVVSESESDKVVCQIEITEILKWKTDERLHHARDFFCRNGMTPFYVDKCGFDDVDSFIQYHRENYAPVKFAHTFELLKGESNA